MGVTKRSQPHRKCKPSPLSKKLNLSGLSQPRSCLSQPRSSIRKIQPLRRCKQSKNSKARGPATHMENFSFPRFQELPVELRLQVWRFALPCDTGPYLVEYDVFDSEDDEDGQGHWFKHPVNGKDGSQRHEYIPTHGGRLFPLPLAFANRESRFVAKGWVQKHNAHFNQKSSEMKGMPMFLSPADLQVDTLYIDNGEKWWDFGDCSETRATNPFTDLQRIAISEDLLVSWEGYAFLLGVMSDLTVIHRHLHTMYIVVGTRPTFSSGERQEIEQLPLGTFTWNSYEGRFVFEQNCSSENDGTSLLQKILYDIEKKRTKTVISPFTRHERVEGICKELACGLVADGVADFKIEFVRARKVMD
ncbi:hypothetical protein K461DRAFT_297353 [Myriangium duriaei CBS 260.36]|uniref:2EXR domain-containing protein n=1 Tax=Myriangium duriaei CBS 260.36 TaxID=1168546 RepID=A0A9P4IUV7_9PEZI|nr:hypothetical protein K461DRAFT_297353 [Myriangium duriaei CBS 260.36]